MTSSASTWQKVWAYRSTWWIILPPILLLPIPLVFQDSVSRFFILNSLLKQNICNNNML